MRSPWLLCMAAMGALIGALLGALLLHAGELHAGGRRAAKGSSAPTREGLQAEALRCWGLALAWFAGMNVSAMLCHVFSVPHSYLHCAAIGLDVACTGSSCLCLLAASILQRAYLLAPRHGKQARASKPPPLLSPGLLSLLRVVSHPATGLALVAAALANNLHPWHLPPSSHHAPEGGLRQLFSQHGGLFSGTLMHPPGFVLYPEGTRHSDLHPLERALQLPKAPVAVPWLNEAIYLGTLLLVLPACAAMMAAFYLGPGLRSSGGSSRSAAAAAAASGSGGRGAAAEKAKRRWANVAWLGLAVGATAPSADRLFCWLQGGTLAWGMVPQVGATPPALVYERSLPGPRWSVVSHARTVA